MKKSRNKKLMGMKSLNSPSSNEFVIVVDAFMLTAAKRKKRVKLTDQRNLEWLNYHVYMNQFKVLTTRYLRTIAPTE